MSEKVLFGAEVNQIQQTLFAASRQRQVVGGSDLLKLFSEAAGEKASTAFGAEEVIVSAGGKFYILFNNCQDAKRFGRFLADSYHFLLEGVMTIAQPVTVLQPVDDHFQAAKVTLDRDLNTRKHRRNQGEEVPHAPTIAFCNTSGYGLAARYKKMASVAGNYEYVSEAAWMMHEAGRETKKGEASSFLGGIREQLPEEYGQYDWAETPEDLSVWDPSRNNVAYIVADGNNMGRYFNHCCTPDELRTLSVVVNEAVQKAIALPIPMLHRRLWESDCLDKPKIEYLPMLPLIAAGDDVFLLLPAPYALDYARRFCLAFENELASADIIKVLQERATLPPPRMSAAVVICKESYPYHLAHEYGERLLKEAKQLAKRTGRETDEWLSAISFGAIVGSEIALGNTEGLGRYQTGWPAYWAIEYPPDQPVPLKAARTRSVDLQTLLIQRVILQRLPSKRLNEARALFDTSQLPTSPGELLEWENALNDLRRRIVATQSSVSLGILDEALTNLGTPKANTKENPGRWHEFRHLQYVQGLPDLLAIWNYAQLLDKPLCDYLQEHEDDH